MSRILNEVVNAEAEMELLCKRCGLCCHTKVWLLDGSGCLIHPSKKCEFLGDDNLCTVYHERFEKASHCLTREEMIAKDYVIPDSCPYSKIRPGYKPAKVVTQDELDYLLALSDFFSAFRPL